MSNPTKQELIEDIRSLSKGVSKVTRNYYRANGTYSESTWQTHFNTFSDFLEAAQLNEQVEIKEELKETNEVSGNNWTITLPKTSIHTLEELIVHCKIDLSIWEVKRFIANKWEMGYKASDGTAESKELFQIKAFLEKKVSTIAVKREIEDLKRLAKVEIVRKVTPVSPTNRTGLMLEVSLFDLHYGKQSWPSETGDRPYDVKIASTMFFRALKELIDRANVYKYELITFVVGNDLLHSNDLESRTASGTVVDSDGRFQKAFWTARKDMCSAVEMLKELAPVKVIVCVGNHDTLSSWCLADSLECWFHNDPSVTIENAPIMRKYQEWGKVGLMYTHGDSGKREQMPLVFATEQPELFGRTKFREIHTGHNHTTKTQEFHGVRVRTLSSLSTPDQWHSANQYTGNLRTGEAFVWSKDNGLIAQFTYCDDAYEPIVTKRELITA